MASKLFEPSSIGTLKLRNRFVRSATWEGLADPDGRSTARLTDLLATLAKGGVGLIISGHAYVTPVGQAGPWQLGAYDASLLTGLEKMADGVHAAGGKIVLQLAHAGAHANFKLTGKLPVGPSIFKGPEGCPICRDITMDEIEQTVDAFANSALLAQKAGFDGVQIHAAHGYLLSQFLSPYYNKRKDEYGGSIENRARIVLEVLKRTRAAVGDGFPVMIKMNAEDFLDPGLTVDEMLTVASLLQKEGIDAVELSGGTQFSGKYTPVRRGKLSEPEDEVYYKEAARRLKNTIAVPLILVGGIRSFEVARRLVDQGVTDYIALCRPLIREPGLVARWQSGDTQKAACLSDNLCFKPVFAGEGLRCETEEKLKGK